MAAGTGGKAPEHGDQRMSVQLVTRPATRILAIAGSLRPGSSNLALVHAIARLAPAGTTVDVYDGLGTLPLFSPDFDGDAPPATVMELRAALHASDAVLVCTPEYAYGMPGALKNALDWLVSSGELYRKPVAPLSASPSPEGGARALAWLRQTLAALDAIVPDDASFAIGLVKEKLHAGVIADPELARRLRAALSLIVDPATGS